jgi:cbb3-type cytochrome oxidase maturation protein
MDIVYLLVPLSLILVFLIGAVFWWALRQGQFDDLEGPAHRIVMDEDRAEGAHAGAASAVVQPNGGIRAGARDRAP